MSSVIHDIDTMIGYVWDNWDTTVIKPEKIFTFRETTKYRLWMFKRAIEVGELDTQYDLGDFGGNFDEVNDTLYTAKVRSKTAPLGGSYDDHAKAMFDEFLKRIRLLAKTDNIGVYAYTQIVNQESPKRKVYFAQLNKTVLLTRRGVGHD